MTDTENDAIYSDSSKILEAINRGVRDALWWHKRMGFPIVVWQDGKVVWIPADEIEVEEPTDGEVKLPAVARNKE